MWMKFWGPVECSSLTHSAVKVSDWMRWWDAGHAVLFLTKRSLWVFSSRDVAFVNNFPPSLSSNPLFYNIAQCQLFPLGKTFRHLISMRKHSTALTLRYYSDRLDILVSIFCLFSSSLPSLAAFFHQFPAILAFLLLPQLSPNIHK